MNRFLASFLIDYVSGGELFTHLYQRDHFSEEEVRFYSGEIILALEHLHKVRMKNVDEPERKETV